MEHSEEFLNIISFESLYNAHRRARLGKRGKREVIEFEMNLSQNLWALHYDLLYGRYHIGEYRRFKIYDPKEREIQAISYRDRIIQHSICDNYLIPILERKLFYYNVACRKNKGTDCAVSTLRRYMVNHYKKFGKSGYFVKIDIKKYFDSISHAVLKKKLSNLAMPDDIYNLLSLIIDSYEHTAGRGIPMGNQSSQCFALLYLDCVDRLIKEKLQVKFYIRYMDDMILIVANKKDAQRILNSVQQKVELQDLCINRKSQVIAFKNGVEFLGRRFVIGSNGKVIQRVKADSRRRIIKKVRHNVYFVKKGRLPRSLLFNSYMSYCGLLSKTNNYAFLGQIRYQLLYA